MSPFTETPFTLLRELARSQRLDSMHKEIDAAVDEARLALYRLDGIDTSNPIYASLHMDAERKIQRAKELVDVMSASVDMQIIIDREFKRLLR